MIINQSTVDMGSRRSYNQTTTWQGQTGLVYLGNKNAAAGGKKQEEKLHTGRQSNTALSISKKSMEMFNKLQELRNEKEDDSLRLSSGKESGQSVESKDELLLETLRRLLESLRKMNGGKNGKKTSWKDLDSQWNTNNSSAGEFSYSSSYSKSSSIGFFAAGSVSMQNDGADRQNGMWVRQRVVSAFHHEEETTAFSSMGMVRTADGREINFNIDLEMSRSFTEEYSLFSKENVIFTDPLVINLNAAAADVSDQKFYFDLDADGEEEEISYLGKGSGFLAYDKNGDGVINDGSELFGTKSGDGFADLAAYDNDGNGWIDENDDIFNKLKVWVKAEDGTDKLLDLKEAGVGAIYLGKTTTQFSLNNAQTNDTNAAIRSTGVFLKENGEAGTIQHVDFVV